MHSLKSSQDAANRLRAEERRHRKKAPPAHRSQTRPKRGTGSLNTLPNLERMLSQVGSRGRNIAIFEALRTYALVTELPSTSDDYLANVLHQARNYHAMLPDVQSNGSFSIDEALRVGRKVAPWTWWFRHKQAGRGRRSGKVRREAVADRDGRILAAHAAGASMRTIAADEGVSPGTVHHVVHRTENPQLELAPPIDLAGWSGRRRKERPDSAPDSYPSSTDEKGSDGPETRPAAYGRGVLYPNPPPRNPGVQ